MRSKAPRSRHPVRRKGSSDSVIDVSAVDDAIVFHVDHETKRRWLATSTVASARRWDATEAELIDAILLVRPDLNREDLLHEALAFFGRRILAVAKSQKVKKSKKETDDRHKRALAELQAANAKAAQAGLPQRKITAWTLHKVAGTAYRTAVRWLARQGQS